MRELKPLSISDKYLFDSFLCVENHSLSAYSFSNLYIWKDLFDINFLLSGKTLYVFFTDTSGMFLQLPPLGSKPDAPELNDIWEMMLETNAAKDSPYATRIANIEEQDIPFYRDLGFKCAPMSSDYVSLRESLSSLSGNKFKAKRALVNHFEKNNTYEYSAFRPEHKDECLALYDFWMREKNDQKHSKIFFGMMQDNFIALNRLLENATDLGSIGRLVRIDGKLKAFTFGTMLNTDTFCVQYEIADLGVKGLSQFIFNSLCRELNCKYVNVMDDSGIIEIKKVKLSYHPEHIFSAYSAFKK